jgi:membrane-bound serine protease (ClpP class)
MNAWVCLLSSILLFSGSNPAQAEQQSRGGVYVIPIQDQIVAPLLYLVRRGVKEAMEARAEVLILDMDTPGGRVDTTEELIEVLGQFTGKLVTYVNRKAFSAGAFISVATHEIYMAPQSVIGAATPVMMPPGGGPVEIPEAFEAKMTSGIKALVRTRAEKFGHNIEVIEAMIDRSRELIIDGEIISREGEVLTLTNMQAEKRYGDDARPLLSLGTVASIEELVKQLGFTEKETVYVNPTGVERMASWINKISPLLLMIGILGLYLEFKTPGFGLPGIAGIIAFVIYFFGGYIAGLSGMEWIALFALGIILIALELFIFPGTFFLGLAGGALVLISVIMAMVDIYPNVPELPAAMQFRIRLDDILLNLGLAILGSVAAIWALSFYLPRSPLYGRLVSQAASGEISVLFRQEQMTRRIGEAGVTLSMLRPGGKARFGNEIYDVVSQGELIPKGSKVRIIRYSSGEAVVEPIDD